ncbi:hypothetical protein AKJ09_06332 [Labilithrix luteola]|uniref:Type IV fimbrial biogenesis protein PilY1 n=1 Tax=Labilithrix luteola TaxID=1391654 RepID=A0A0K1Q1L3_9BACT|nr:hypothetical protein [Labilithrix luteola]AKU99668.1 hypothetical protein AKJ09_06332 [Labilithrix luteola]
MRRALILAWAPCALALGLVNACASADEVAQTPAPAPTGVEAVPEAAPPVEASSVDAGVDAAESTCSEAGWCTTVLPDSDLVMRDVWPVADGSAAFAIAESPTRGVKVLLWEKSGNPDNSWKYIDDNTQNAPGHGKYAGGVWAPSANEAYFTVAPATVYHGTRPADPTAAWSWTSSVLADHSPDLVDAPSALPHDHGYPMNPVLEGNYPALGVWGTGASDVYAWFANTVYHWTTDDSGNFAWVAEYIADDAESDPEDPSVVEHIYIVSATGTGPDDVWFSGTRDRYPYGTACGLLVHKAAGVYSRVADGIVPSAGGKGQTCQGRRGVFLIEGRDGWLTDIQEIAPEHIVGLKGGRDVMRLTSVDGAWNAELFDIPQPVTVFKSGLSSLWSPPLGKDVPSDQLWLSGFGLVLRGADVWNGDPFQVSTISLNGAPTRRPIHRVRGASSHDLWAVGVRYAFHNTTP